MEKHVLEAITNVRQSGCTVSLCTRSAMDSLTVSMEKMKKTVVVQHPLHASTNAGVLKCVFMLIICVMAGLIAS